MLGGLLDAAAAANAEALARREGRELVGKARGVEALTAVPASLLERKPAACASALAGLGCLGVTEALSPATAATLLAFVGEENAARQADVVAGRAAFGTYFGGVNCRGMRGPFGQRQDLFLPLAAPVVRAAVRELATNLQPLLHELCGPDAALHELSCIVAEPGAPRQCVHADTSALWPVAYAAEASP